MPLRRTEWDENKDSGAGGPRPVQHWTLQAEVVFGLRRQKNR
jgi:hypothetical protein